MKCQEVHTLIQSYFQDQLDEYTKIKIHHHLAGCTSCTEDFRMWERGEEFISKPQTLPAEQAASTPKSLVMNQVMERIKQEEKWANPSVKSEGSYRGRSKRALMAVACTLMLFFVILVTSTFTPLKEVLTEDEDTALTLDHVEETWDMNTIVLMDKAIDVETTMNFQVVASVYDPITITYALPDEESRPLGNVVLFSIFGLLCIIISLSWITRV